jgi:hypothetical protein
MSSFHHRCILETMSTGKKIVIIKIKVWTHTFRDKSHVEGTHTYARYEFKELQNIP